MKTVWLLGLVVLGLGPCGAFAGNEYQDLSAKVAAAEGRLAEVQARLEKTRAEHGAADKELRGSVEALVRAGRYPRGFWLARSVLADAPLQADVVGVVGRQQASILQKSRTEAGALADLYGKANAQLDEVRQVQAAYADAKGKLAAAEVKVLQRAGMQADALDEGLQAALAGNLTAVKVPVLSVPSGALPVAGRVVKGFGAGEGAVKGGVVLKAAEGQPVRATQAGKVLFAGPFRAFGGLVIVKTVRGEDVLLGGMGGLSVNAGEDVAAGQGLGVVGKDGRLYWEVRRNGRLVDPL